MTFCRVPKFKPSVLTGWCRSDQPSHVAQLVRYLSAKTAMVLEMLDAAEIVTKTAQVCMQFGLPQQLSIGDAVNSPVCLASTFSLCSAVAPSSRCGIFSTTTVHLLKM